MSNRILSDYRKIISHKEIARISLVIPPKFISHKARISGEFYSRNDSHSTSDCGALDLKMEGAVHDEKSSLKMLGLSFSSKLNLDIYIVHRSKTASKGIGALTYFLKSISS